MSEDIYSSVKKEIGETSASSSNEVNAVNMRNLDKEIELIKGLILDLAYISKGKSRPEINYQSSGIVAYMSLLEIKKLIENNI